MTSGSILEGPDSTKLKPLVEQVLPILLQLMKDPVVAVKVGGAGQRLCRLVQITSVLIREVSWVSDWSCQVDIIFKMLCMIRC